MFTGLNYQYATSLAFLSNSYPDTFSGMDYTEWWKNGILQVAGVDYNWIYDDYGYYITNSWQPFNITDTFELKVFSDLAHTIPFSGGASSGIVNILPRFSYLELLNPSNGILSTDTTDKSIELNTPINIFKCNNDTIVNGHFNSVITFQNDRTNTNSYTTGALNFNGVPLDLSWITNSNIETGSFSFNGSGELTHDCKHIYLARIEPNASFNITYQHNGTNTEDDFSFAVNNIGFGKLGSDGFINRYKIINGNNVGAFITVTNNSLFEIIKTPTDYTLKVDGVIVLNEMIYVEYSSTIGVISNIAQLPINTSVTHLANNIGIGYIEAKFNNTIIARQLVNIIDVPAPIFINGNNYNNLCPFNIVDLSLLTVTNQQLGFTLKYYSDLALTNEITNLNISSSQTIYASYEVDGVLNCNSLITTLNITINNCATLIDHVYTVPINTIINGDVSIGGLSC